MSHFCHLNLYQGEPQMQFLYFVKRNLCSLLVLTALVKNEVRKSAVSLANLGGSSISRAFGIKDYISALRCHQFLLV